MGLTWNRPLTHPAAIKSRSTATKRANPPLSTGKRKTAAASAMASFVGEEGRRRMRYRFLNIDYSSSRSWIGTLSRFQFLPLLIPLPRSRGALRRYIYRPQDPFVVALGSKDLTPRWDESLLLSFFSPLSRWDFFVVFSLIRFFLVEEWIWIPRSSPRLLVFVPLGLMRLVIV